jgi:hypothetical protein
MINAWLEPFCEPLKPLVYCPSCSEEAELNDENQIECMMCKRCFELSGPDYDEECAYGH